MAYVAARGGERAIDQAERLFRATARLTLPEHTSADDVQAALEAISGEIMVDFTLKPA